MIFQTNQKARFWTSKNFKIPTRARWILPKEPAPGRSKTWGWKIWLVFLGARGYHPPFYSGNSNGDEKMRHFEHIFFNFSSYPNTLHQRNLSTCLLHFSNALLSLLVIGRQENDFLRDSIGKMNLPSINKIPSNSRAAPGFELQPISPSTVCLRHRLPCGRQLQNLTAWQHRLQVLTSNITIPTMQPARMTVPLHPQGSVVLGEGTPGVSASQYDDHGKHFPTGDRCPHHLPPPWATLHQCAEVSPFALCAPPVRTIVLWKTWIFVKSDTGNIKIHMV